MSDKPNATNPAVEHGATGGRVRAQNLSPEERRAIAVAAAEARWARMRTEAGGPALQATHTGETRIGDIAIPCAVLEDGTRLITQRGIYEAIGRSPSTGGLGKKGDAHQLPRFLAPANLKPFISSDLERAAMPIVFKSERGLAYGFRAEIMPKLVNVYLDAQEAGALKDNQKDIARRCKILSRGLQEIGIIGLIDEATGYQEVRSRRALEEILNRYLSNELRKWTKTFPHEYFSHMFRLRGWRIPTMPTARPGAMAQFTNDIVYSRLAPGVLRELQALNPTDGHGRRKHKLFQHLTPDHGHPKLKEHLNDVVVLMKAAASWSEFRKLLDRVKPRVSLAGELPFNPGEEANA